MRAVEEWCMGLGASSREACPCWAGREDFSERVTVVLRYKDEAGLITM